MTTSNSDASKASKLLRTSKSKTVRSVAASDLAQAKHHKRKAGARKLAAGSSVAVEIM